MAGKVTIQDLWPMTENREYGGFGFLGHLVRNAQGWFDHNQEPYSMPEKVDRAVIEAFNNLHAKSRISRDNAVKKLFLWANSSAGRHCGDALQDAEAHEFVAIIENSMTQFYARMTAWRGEGTK